MQTEQRAGVKTRSMAPVPEILRVVLPSILALR